MKFEVGLLLQSLLFVSQYIVTSSSYDAKRLYDDLIESGHYNRLVRPVNNSSQKLTVKLGIRLSQLIDVEEKNQIMTTNIWLRQRWYDFRLKWRPEEYGGQRIIQIPPDKIWTPDIVLFNNADGIYEINMKANSVVHYNGYIEWDPPAIYKSMCTIDVEYFPYDIQVCSLKFGSWTYFGDDLNLEHFCHHKQDENGQIENGIEIGFDDNTEWDILGVPAYNHVEKFHCCNNVYIKQRLIFSIRMRRKTQPYTVNLIIPCIAHSLLTFLVFYLPSESGEKITMSLTVLLSLTVFILLQQEMVPANSMVVPLIGKYLLFVLILVTLSIVATVIVLNVHFRSPDTDTISTWVRRCFLDILPKLLLMRKPMPEERAIYNPTLELPKSNIPHLRSARLYSCDMTYNTQLSMFLEKCEVDGAHERSDAQKLQLVRYNQEAVDAINGVDFIAKHYDQEMKREMVCADWRYISLVLDRLFFILFSLASFAAALGIILQAPTLYNVEEAVNQLQTQSSQCLNEIRY